MRRTALVVAATGVLCASAAAQLPVWTQIATATTPNAEHSHAMVYDATRDRVVMFGGISASHSNDTWEYDSVNWTQVTTSNSPGGRYGHAMVYDNARGKVVMFGGTQVGPSSLTTNDTWEYDGINWTNVTTSSSPSARRNHAMVYDIARGKVVMFGGDLVGGGGFISVNDTWEFDGVNWAQITTTTSPTARLMHAMAYDGTRGQAVMFGGLNSFGWLGDTWEFDGTNWTQVTTANAPVGRFQHTMQYDSARGNVLLHGGRSDNANQLNDVWRYDGLNWSQIAPIGGPGGRSLHAMAYDSVTGKVIMFGGWSMPTAHDDTWEFDAGSITGLQASATNYGSGCGNPALAFASTANPAIGTTANALILNTPTSLTGVAMGLSDSILTGLPVLPIDLSIVGMSGCHLLQSNDAFGLSTTTLQPSIALFNFAIPSAPSLLGLHVYAQAYAFAPAVNALQVIASNGIDWLIGNQ